jgi:acetyl esterase/lipase
MVIPAPAQESSTSKPATAPTTAESKPPIVLAANTAVTSNISYTSEKNVLQTLDVYAPRDAKNAPVWVFVHGGGWTQRDKDEVGSQPKLFNEAGIIVVSINYRLAPAVRHPTNAQDVAAAIAWIHSNIQRFGGDPAKIVLMGHSAGSHLVALVATDDRLLAAHGMHRNILAGVVSLDGSAFDIPDRIKKGSQKIVENCRRAFGEDEAVQSDGSPVNHVKGDFPLPSFLLVYLKDGSLNHAQSHRFAALVTAQNGKAKVVHVEGNTHQALCDELGAEHDPAGAILVDFVRSVTR